MEVDRPPVSTRDRPREVICSRCGKRGHYAPGCPSKSGNGFFLGVVGGELLGVSFQAPKKCVFPVSFVLYGQERRSQAYLDSGSSGNFVSARLVKDLGLPTQQLATPIRVRVVDGSHLGPEVTHATEPVIFRVGNHQEHIQFLVLPSSVDPILLGLPWLQRHSPSIDWRSGKIVGWSPPCKEHCIARTLSPVPNSELEDLPLQYKEFSDVFCKRSADRLPQHRPYDCPIDLVPGATPPRGAVYPLSLPETEAMSAYIQENLAKGFIRKSTSPAGAGFFFVTKKDGSLRPCIDYRGLNAVTIKNRYPLPLISELFDRIRGAKIFTKLDLRGAYNLLRIREGDEWKTAFNTRDGHYEYLVMPFGLCNAPGVFQDVMNDIFRDLTRTSVIVYLDDILIFSEEIRQHRQVVREVLSRLRQNSLYAKLEKCLFEQQTVPFLGHILSGQGISMDPDKAQAIQDWPKPQALKAVQRFLGFANYYRRFVPHFSTLVAPLAALTRKGADPKNWTTVEEEAFSMLKRSFLSASVLHRPDTSRPFFLEVDASAVGAGAMLFQRGPQGKKLSCGFFSKAFTPAERNYSIGDRELLAIKLALEEWRHLLEGAAHQVTIYTDHKNLTYLQTAQRLNPRQARWAEFFIRFDFVLHYVPGVKNVRADALSRSFDPTESVPESPRLVIPAVKHLPVNPLRFGRDPGDKTFVSPQNREAVLAWGHASRLGGHQGAKKTIDLIKRYYWWPHLAKDVQDYTQGCITCARNKPCRQRPAGLLMPLPTPESPWQNVSMDFITDLPLSSGNTVIWVIVDQFSKACHLVALPGLPSAPRLAGLFFQHIFRLHGLPRRLLSDRGPQFTSRFWGELCRLLGISRDLTSAYHPQSNGLSERLNQSLQTYLRHFVSARHDDWSDLLPWAEFSFNNSLADATGQTPFYTQSGQHPHLPLPIPVVSEVPAVADLAVHLREVWEQTQRSLSSAKDRMKVQADRHRRPAPEFSPGDLVWLSSRFIRLRVASLKFAPRFLGPFRVLTRVNPLAYKLRLPPSWRVDNTFHVSLLHPFRQNRFSSLVPQVSEQVEGDFEISDILDSRTVRGRTQYLVDWVGYGPEDRSWVAREDLHAPRLLAAYERRRARREGGTVRHARRVRGRARLTDRRPLVASSVEDGELPGTSSSTQVRRLPLDRVHIKSSSASTNNVQTGQSLPEAKSSFKATEHAQTGQGSPDSKSSFEATEHARTDWWFFRD